MAKNDWTELYMLEIFFVLISSHQILRQFEALMGGSAHAPRQDAANSSHQATTNHTPTSTYLNTLLPTHSPGNLNHHQPDILHTHGNNPSSSASLAQRDSSGELMNEADEEKLSPIQVEPVRTAGAESVAEESASCPSPQGEQPCLSRLSLFSGMQLVTKGRHVCQEETSQTETDDSFREDPAVQNCISITSDDAPSVCNSVASDSSQPVSAFSFVSF